MTENRIDEEYFEEVLSFLKRYQVLYNYANTDILVLNVLEKIKEEFSDQIDQIQFDVFDFDIASLKGNLFLNSLLGKIRDLDNVGHVTEECVEYFEDIGDVPVGPKKKHEIINLSKAVFDLCQEVGCNLVVDLGSGLGYLSELLYKKYKLKVLGLEANPQYIKSARKRQEKYHQNSKDNVKYAQIEIKEDSDVDIEKLVWENFPEDERFCLVGLHACGDLTVDSLRLYLKMRSAVGLAIMPCCYHRIKIDNSVCDCLRNTVEEEELSDLNVNGERFENFPLSTTFKRVFDSEDGSFFLRRPFLRLACQQPVSDETLNVLVFRLVARACLQLFAFQNNYKLVRRKRKAVKKRETTLCDFDLYLKDAITNGFTLEQISNNQSYPKSGYEERCGMSTDENDSKIGSEIEFEKLVVDEGVCDEEDLKAIWLKYNTPSMEDSAKFLILLQRNLQPICEKLVLVDRLVFLRENGCENVKLAKVADETVSPRCFALIARK